MTQSTVYDPTWVTDQLAVAAAPMSYAQLDHLKCLGVGAILNLCGEFCDLHEIEASAGFEVYYLPLADEEAPELAELEKALAWLDEAIYLGKKVLIHCRHGIGRTGTVLNAYLLRRGLGHRLSWLKLRSLRSKPANFEQWWTIRKYGKKSPKLTVCEPSLEMRRAVNLAPLFQDYEALATRVDDLAGYELHQSCGRDHDRCCRTPIGLRMIEAVYLTHKLNVALTSEARLEAIDRAVHSARQERAVARDMPGTHLCLSDANALCPLSVQGLCIVYASRPLQCRTFGLDADTSADLWDSVLVPALDRLSLELWMAFAGTIARTELPAFALTDVVSGKYVQNFFHLMLEAEGR
ncbi:dual specificity protein phosphatase family protein [Desulfovibrionales bacterium]